MAEPPASAATDFDAARLAAKRDFESSRAVERLWAKDHTLWQPTPDECADRLGWLDAPAAALDDAATLLTWCATLRDQGIERVVWCGMGGSSLFPELVSAVPLARADGLPLQVLDTSHPAAVRRVLDAVGSGLGVLVVFASKSGGTIETRTQLDVLSAACPDATFVVVTDPGSALEALANERGWTVWTADPNIGGRFSALSRFGTVATALGGVDPTLIARPALDLATACHADTDNPGLELAAFLAAAAATGRDKLTVVTPPTLAGLGPWVEQLVAESTGKGGAGLLPVVDEPLGTVGDYGDDRVFVTYGSLAAVQALRDAGRPVLDLGPVSAGALGAELMRWMLATAWLGAALRLNPFDQPDVESAKRAALAALQGAATESPEPGDPAPLLAALRPGDHIVIQAFVDPGGPLVHELDELRLRLRARHGCAVTVGIGPRYLHSSGQLHKGGPNNGVFLQVLDPGPDDVAIPGRDFGFAALLRAQADGDHAALVAAGRRVMRVAPEAILASA